jgi:hypothetical protein
MMRKRSAEPKESLIDALILDEMQKMTSLVEDDGSPQNTAEGSASLDPNAFVNTQNWTGELLSGGQPQQQPRDHERKMKRPTRPPPTKSASQKNAMATPQPGELESLEQMLEPERTGVHNKGEGSKPPWLLIALILVLLAAGAAAAVVFAMR